MTVRRTTSARLPPKPSRTMGPSPEVLSMPTISSNPSGTISWTSTPWMAASGWLSRDPGGDLGESVLDRGRRRQPEEDAAGRLLVGQIG